MVFQLVAHRCVWELLEERIGHGRGVPPKDVSEIAFGGVRMALRVLVEVKLEQPHRGDLTHDGNPGRDREPQLLGVL